MAPFGGFGAGRVLQKRRTPERREDGAVDMRPDYTRWIEALTKCVGLPEVVAASLGVDESRGKLVRWAAERGYVVEALIESDPRGRFAFYTDAGPHCAETFDDALISGCIALAEQEATR